MFRFTLDEVSSDSVFVDYWIRDKFIVGMIPAQIIKGIKWDCEEFSIDGFFVSKVGSFHNIEYARRLWIHLHKYMNFKSAEGLSEDELQNLGIPSLI